MSLAKKSVSISAAPPSPAPDRPSTSAPAVPIDPYLYKSRRATAWREASVPKPWHPAKRPVDRPSTSLSGDAPLTARLTGRRHLLGAPAAQSQDIIREPPASIERMHKKVSTVSFITTAPNTSLTARRGSTSKLHRRKSLEAARAAFVQSTKPRSLGMDPPAREPQLKLSSRDQNAQPVSGRRHYAPQSSIVPPWIAA